MYNTRPRSVLTNAASGTGQPEYMRVNCLMLAFAFVLPYHVLRTAAGAGHRVHVLGNGPSRGLKWSRHCASYRESRFDRTGEADDLLLAEIRNVVRDHDIDIILPSDDVSTRLIAALRPRLPVPSSLVPEVASFDLLNDKWRFTRFCAEHGVRAPQGWLYRSAADLRAALDDGSLQLPLTVKPLNYSAGVGVLHLTAPADLTAIEAIDYRPILVQRHIFGETIGINVLCRDGEILAHATQRRDDRRFELFANPDLLANVTRLAAAARFTGPANLDVVLEDATGLGYIVECNPRFWYSIYMAMIVGANFVDLAIRGRSAPPLLDASVRLSLGEIVRRPWQATRTDWKMVHYHLSDPIPFLFQRSGAFDGRDISVPPTTTAGDDEEPQSTAAPSSGGVSDRASYRTIAA